MNKGVHSSAFLLKQIDNNNKQQQKQFSFLSFSQGCLFIPLASASAGRAVWGTMPMFNAMFHSALPALPCRPCTPGKLWTCPSMIFSAQLFLLSLERTWGEGERFSCLHWSKEKAQIQPLGTWMSFTTSPPAFCHLIIWPRIAPPTDQLNHW